MGVNEEMDTVFKTERGTFNFRIVGVWIENGHVLFGNCIIIQLLFKSLIKRTLKRIKYVQSSFNFIVKLS